MTDLIIVKSSMTLIYNINIIAYKFFIFIF